ncbi:MAG TPA: TonB-dependent receptor [Pantanalinema sp.]
MNARTLASTAIALAATVLVASPSLAATLSGTVKDKQTGRPVASARITVVGPDRRAEANTDGSYRLEGLKPGTFPVKVEAPGYLPLVIGKVPFSDERPVTLNATLKAGTLSAPAQVVSADRPARLAQTETSRRSFTADEVRKVAGARNDPILAVTNTAGVNAGGFSGAPVVRGGGPMDNRYYLDNIQIGNPFHFGGLVSVFNANTLSRVDLYTGALPARFGNVKSAVIDVESRAPKSDALHGVLDANLLYSEGLLEGPLAPGLSFSLSGRRSYMDLLVAKLVPSFTVFPRFSDYQVKVSRETPGDGRLDFLAIGSSDALALVLPDGTIGRGVGTISQDDGYRSTGMTWRQPIGDGASNRLTINYQEPFQNVKVGTFLDVGSNQYQVTLADDLVHQVNEQHQLRTGVRYDTINFLERRLIPKLPAGTNPGTIRPEDIEALPKLSTDTTGNQKVYGAYVEDAWKVMDPLTLSLGLRYDRLQSTSEDHVAPRLGTTWRMDEDTTWRLGYGQQFQFPEVSQLLPGVGNPKLTAPFSRDYVVGLDRQLLDNLLGKFELYHRDLLFLVASDPASNFSNGGSGYSNGAEATLELAQTAGWSGSLALTYSRTFREIPSVGHIPYDYDQPLVANLNLVAPKAGEWSPSLRLRYSSGRPYTPVTGRFQKPDGTWAPISGGSNSARYPDGITWSARVERPAGMFGREGLFYLEVTQQREALAIDYGKDYADYANPTYNYGIPAIPYIGYQLRF